MFVRRTYFGQFDELMIRFLIELSVRQTWFGQFDELYFVNWLVQASAQTCGRRAADSMTENVGKSQVNILSSPLTG